MEGRRGNDWLEPREALLKAIGRAYAGALLTGDEVAAEQAVRDAMDSRLSPAEIDDEIITPALWLVGRLWERGEISIADEHLATEITLRVLALRQEIRRTVAARVRGRVLLAAAQGELHVVALRMTADLLRDSGYRVTMLGADVPRAELAHAARRHQPDVVCLSATVPDAGGHLAATIEQVQQAWPPAAFMLGGSGVPPRLRPRPGIEICVRVSEAVETVDALVKRADLN